MKKLLVLIALLQGVFAGELAKEKTIGLELNPVTILTAGAMASGGFSYFDHDRGVEIAVPFFYYGDDNGEEYMKDGSYQNDKFTQVNVDIHYRKYHDGTIGGFYYGGLARYTYLDGKLKDEFMNARVSKVGLAAEIGYKTFGIFGYEQLYWGVSLALGAYLDDKYDQFKEPMLGDSIALVDVEFFKFGVSF